MTTNEAKKLEEAEGAVLELLGKRIAAGTAKSGDLIAWAIIRMTRELRAMSANHIKLYDAVGQISGQ